LFSSLFHSSLRLTAIGLAVASFAVASVAFTGSNDVPETSVGEGAQAISGYTSTNVNYSLNGTDPQKLDQVTFNLDRAPSAGAAIRVRLVSTGSWYTCTNSGAAVSCATTSPQAMAAAVNELRLVVAN
jgi:hypothetical protein